ncbi:MAG: radical SAM protein [Proteobacteria bacterium]|nr:radical SAM protein [Pseudomonadota bacterium]
MIEKIFGKFFQGRKGKPFSVWQIELTTRCPLLCKMCIRSETTEWQYLDMPLEDFKKILPYLKDVETVVLEGWGESLLHKDLAECVRLVKKEGPQAGFVTSAKGLSKDRISELVDAGVDFVGFSIAGTTPETHDAIRVNSHLPEVLEAIRLFREEKQLRGLSRPRMHMIFLMVKDNAHEAPLVPSLAKDAGIEDVLITNLCHAINPWQETQRVFVWENLPSHYEEFLRQADANAQKLNIRLKKSSLSAFPVPVCAENPLRNLYISSEGEVSPCVYLYPPLPSPFKRIFREKEYLTAKIAFGNVFRDPFPSIWNSSAYEAFRNRFRVREKGHRELFFSLFDSPRLQTAPGCVLPDPPDPCKTCHKILGI